jgi:hypothetical protein
MCSILTASRVQLPPLTAGSVTRQVVMQEVNDCRAGKPARRNGVPIRRRENLYGKGAAKLRWSSARLIEGGKSSVYYTLGALGHIGRAEGSDWVNEPASWGPSSLGHCPSVVFLLSFYSLLIDRRGHIAV